MFPRPALEFTKQHLWGFLLTRPPCRHALRGFVILSEKAICAPRYLLVCCSSYPSVPFLSKVTAKSGSIGLRTHFGLSCLSYSLPFIKPFRYCQSPMEIAAVTGTEPSPEQFLHKRGKTRSWPPREKGIVYDPAQKSLAIHRIKKIERERSSKLPGYKIHTGNGPDIWAPLQKLIQPRSTCAVSSHHPTSSMFSPSRTQ